MRKLSLLLLAAAAALGVSFASPAEAAPTVPSTFTPPCSSGDVQCEGESSNDADEGNWCSYDHDGNPATPALGGHVNKHGQCVCATPPSTTTSTSTTVPQTTTSTVAPTTSTTVTPTTAPPTTATPTTAPPTTEEPPTTVVVPTTLTPANPVTSAPLPNRPTTTAGPGFVARPVASGELPRTGADSTGIMVATGVGLIALGGALAYTARKRFAA
jgi:LPXTG-motif cell wall-anchored protein